MDLNAWQLTRWIYSGLMPWTNGAYEESWTFAGTTLSEMPTSVALRTSHHFRPSLSPVVSLSLGILREWMRTQMLAKPSLNLLQKTEGDHRGGRAQLGWRTFMMTCLWSVQWFSSVSAKISHVYFILTFCSILYMKNLHSHKNSIRKIYYIRSKGGIDITRKKITRKKQTWNDRPSTLFRVYKQD